MTYPRFYHVSIFVAARLAEGAKVAKVEVGDFSSLTKATSAMRSVLRKPTLLYSGSGVVLGVRIREVVANVVNEWLQAMPQTYCKTWLYDRHGEETCRTPGIFELWRYGTTRTPQRYQVGDIVATMADAPDGTIRLGAGVVTVVPGRTDPAVLRRVHRRVLHNNVDVTDQYLWYAVRHYPSRPLNDVRLCQTQILPLVIELSRPRRRALQKMSAALIDHAID